MSDSKKTTFTVDEEDGYVFRLWKTRTGYDISEILHMIAEKAKIIMCDGVDERASRLNFGVFANIKDSMVEIRFSPLFMGLEGLTQSQRDDVLRGFDYSTDGKYTDYREHPELRPKEEKQSEKPKNRFTEKIQKQHDEDVKKEESA
jgi:hypothetical protein